jgi:hypothetical protein
MNLPVWYSPWSPPAGIPDIVARQQGIGGLLQSEPQGKAAIRPAELPNILPLPKTPFANFSPEELQPLQTGSFVVKTGLNV